MLAMMLAPAATAAPSSPSDGTYTYVSSMNGVAVGKTAITVTHGPSGIIVSEQGGGTFNGQQGTVKDTLTLDPQALAPVGFTLNAIVEGRPVNAALTFQQGAATQTGDLSQKSYALPQNAKHFVVLDMGPFSGWFALPAQMQAWSGEPALAIVPEIGSAIPITPDASVKADRPANVPAADTAISVTSPMPFTIWFDPKTMLVDRLDFPTQGVTVTRQA